jgi:hypothetical protein
MKLFLTLLLLLLFDGCAITSYTKEEIAWRNSIDMENWTLCMKYTEPSIHRGHVHRKGVRVHPAHIKTDLFDNKCKETLGIYWAGY